MAASMVCRFALLSRCRVTALSGAVTGKRFLLSSAYVSDKTWEKWEKETHNLSDLAALMEKCYERKIPVSSLVIKRESYISLHNYIVTANLLHKHKEAHRGGTWTTPRSAIVMQNSAELLKTLGTPAVLANGAPQVQYGMFPDNFTFNLLLDTFIKSENFEDAVSLVVEIMLQESFDTVSTQLLSLYVLHKYLSGNPQLMWEQERNMGASLLLAGLRQENTVGYSSQLYGYTLIGKVELSKGLRAVYTQMPLIWKPGYFQRALDVMEKVSQLPGESKICKETIDILKSVLDSAISSQLAKTSSESSEDSAEQFDDSEKIEADLLGEYLTRFQDLSTKLDSLSKIESASLLSLTTHLIHEKLPECEKSDIEKYEALVKEWEQEQSVLTARETEMREKAKEQYEAMLASKAAN